MLSMTMLSVLAPLGLALSVVATSTVHLDAAMASVKRAQLPAELEAVLLAEVARTNGACLSHVRIPASSVCGTTGSNFDPEARCPTNTSTDPSEDAERLLGSSCNSAVMSTRLIQTHARLLGCDRGGSTRRGGAMHCVARMSRHLRRGQDLFECPMMNITQGGVSPGPGHNTEHYKARAPLGQGSSDSAVCMQAYLRGHQLEFNGDEYAPDPSHPGSKLFSVTCLKGHCGLYIPYYWLQTDPAYQFASVFYCWPLLPWLVRGYLITSRNATRPPGDVVARFRADAEAQGLLASQTILKWHESEPCWGGAADGAPRV